MATNHTPADDSTDPIDLALNFEPAVSYTLADIDGLDEKTDRLRTVVDPLVRDASIKRHSVLIHGPSGTGKTRLAEALAGELATEQFSVGWLRDFDDYEEDAHDVVVQAVRDALAAAPSVLVFDQVLTGHQRQARKRLREELVQVVEGGERVLVVATASPDPMGGNLAETFDMCVRLETPDDQRTELLIESFLREFSAQSTETVDVVVDTSSTNLCETAAELTASELNRAIRGAFAEAIVDCTADETPVVTTERLQTSFSALKNNRPGRSNRPFLRRSEPNRFVEETSVSFADIGGLDDVKAELRGALEYPMRFEETFESCNLASPGVLLYGAPGNGKTMLAKALANEYDRSFIAVNGPELKNKYVGETEKNIRKVFETAREQAPSVVFFDEIDTLAGRRADASASYEVSFVNTLLAELDGFRDTSDVFVLAATNRPAALDGALLREGRLGRHIHVPLPDEKGVRAIIATHTEGFPLADDVTPEWVAEQFSEAVPAATITGVCDHALRWHAMRRAEDDGTLEVTRTDVREAVDAYPTSSPDDDDTGSPTFH